MVICKYFLQGTCRFGENCKFEHQINTDHSYAGSSSVLVQNYANKPAQSASNVDTNTLVKAVVNDMMLAEKGGQWLLSSYAPFRDKPPFPGFEDHSMEEIRYLFYESAKNGTVDQFRQNLQMMLQQAVIRIKALQNPSPDAINMLKNIYNTPPSSQFNNTQLTNSVFSTQQTQQKSVFGNTSQPSSQGIFGGGGQTPSVFGASTSVFGAPTTKNSIFSGQQNKSIFSSPQPIATTSSVFGATNTQSIFGNPPQNKSFFNQNNQAFAQNTMIQPQSIFHQNQFVNQQNQNQFASQQNQSNQFGQSQQNRGNQFAQTQQSQGNQFAQTQQNQSNQFAQIQQNQSNQFVAQQQNPTSPFGVQQAQSTQFRSPPTSQFGAPQSNLGVLQASGTQFVGPQVSVGNKPALQHSQSIFGNFGMQQQNSGLGDAQAHTKPNEEFYSKLEELSEEEIRWFQSDDMDVSKIPEKPPTYEMCFKVQ